MQCEPYLSHVNTYIYQSTDDLLVWKIAVESLLLMNTKKENHTFKNSEYFTFILKDLETFSVCGDIFDFYTNSSIFVRTEKIKISQPTISER